MHSSTKVSNPFPLISYILFKLVGLAPFNIKINSKNKQSPIFVHSHFGTLYNFLLILIILSFTPKAIHSIQTINYMGKTSTTEVIELAEAALGVAVVVIVWVYMIINQKITVKIANSWENTDKAVKTLEYVKNHNCNSLQLPIYFTLNLIIWVNMIWSDIVCFDEWFRKTFVVISIPSFLFSWLILQYTFVLILLKDRFRALNEGLYRISSTAFVVPYYFNSSEGALDSVIAKDLLVIKESHEVFYEIACDISSLYSFPIFLIISVLCASIIHSSYYFATILLMADDSKGLIVFNSVCYLTMEIFPIAVLSVGVTKVIHEMKLTAVAIHKLLTRSFVKPELMSQLKLFSLELLHRNVEFTGCNIFSLDGTLLHSILNTTATYLIILFQFGQSNKSTSAESPMTNISAIGSINSTDTLKDIKTVSDEL